MHIHLKWRSLLSHPSSFSGPWPRWWMSHCRTCRRGSPQNPPRPRAASPTSRPDAADAACQKGSSGALETKLFGGAATHSTKNGDDLGMVYLHVYCGVYTFTMYTSTLDAPVLSQICMVRHLRLALTGGENKSTLTIRTHGNRIVRINMCALYAHIDIQLYMIVNMHFTSAFAFAYIICVFRCPFKVQSPFYRTWDQSHLPGSFC